MQLVVGNVIRHFISYFLLETVTDFKRKLEHKKYFLL